MALLQGWRCSLRSFRKACEVFLERYQQPPPCNQSFKQEDCEFECEFFALFCALWFWAELVDGAAMIYTDNNGVRDSLIFCLPMLPR